jgi:hypothetical protein
MKEARPLPSEPKLNRSANMSQPASDGSGEIPGTFAMDHRVWLEYFLLPQLQELCSATQMWCGEAERRLDDDGSPAMWPKYALGRGLQGMESKKASHADFRLQPAGPRHYRWSQQSDVYSKPYHYIQRQKIELIAMRAFEFDVSKGYNDTTCASKSEVNVTWDAGSDTLRVNGKIWYDFVTRFASNSSFNDDLHERK